MNKKIIIVGAGPGGLAAGMLLAHNGFSVTILEKEKEVGGRSAPLQVGDFTFDTGPTFFMMPEILEKIFQMTGRDLHAFVTLKRIDPLYHLYFKDQKLKVWEHPENIKKEFAEHLPGDEKNVDLFWHREEKRFKHLMPCFEKDYGSLRAFFRKDFINAIPYLGIVHSIYKNLERYFKNDLARLSFTFQAKYIGMSPWECPEAFTLISFMEHHSGIHHVQGGLNMLAKAMARVITEEGGTIRLETPVKKCITKKGKVMGVLLENGEEIFADEVILNADFSYAMKYFFDVGVLKKYTEKKLLKKGYSCSTFMMYLGLDTIYPLPHHNIFFAENYRENIDAIGRGELSEDFSFYVQNASVTDESLAPKGKSTVYVLVPVPNKTGIIDWQKEKSVFREKVLHALRTRVFPDDFEKHIEVERIISPDDWESKINVFLGATFNLAHTPNQMLYFRPHNKFEELENCYIVGGGTHPGSGLPTIYESGRISAELIIKKYNST